MGPDGPLAGSGHHRLVRSPEQAAAFTRRLVTGVSSTDYYLTRSRRLPRVVVYRSFLRCVDTLIMHSLERQVSPPHTAAEKRPVGGKVVVVQSSGILFVPLPLRPATVR